VGLALQNYISAGMERAQGELSSGIKGKMGWMDGWMVGLKHCVVPDLAVALPR